VYDSVGHGFGDGDGHGLVIERLAAAEAATAWRAVAMLVGSADSSISSGPTLLGSGLMVAW
jgi:hypothetical protein